MEKKIELTSVIPRKPKLDIRQVPKIQTAERWRRQNLAMHMSKGKGKGGV